MMLTVEEVEQYKDPGYIVVPDLPSSDTVVKIRAVTNLVQLQRILEAPRQPIGPDVRFDKSTLNLKVADRRSAVEWRQDKAFHPRLTMVRAPWA